MSSARGEARIDQRRSASCIASTCFQPWVTAVDRLIYRGARINRAAVAPHAFVPALTGEVIGFADQCLAMRRFSADCSAKIVVIARDFTSSFLRALRSPPDSGVWWCFGDIPLATLLATGLLFYRLPKIEAQNRCPARQDFARYIGVVARH